MPKCRVTTSMRRQPCRSEHIAVWQALATAALLLASAEPGAAQSIAGSNVLGVIAPPIAVASNRVSESDNDAFVAQILGRPLFTPGRRPPAPPAPPAPAPLVVESPKRSWDWRLAGIMMSPDKREALFVRDDLRLTVEQGEDIDGWTLVAIGPDNVQIEGEGGKKLLRPQADTSADAGATAANKQKLVLKAPTNLPTLRQTRVAFLAAAKKSLEEEKKRGKLVLRPHGPPPG
jgi:hypothetical protein